LLSEALWIKKNRIFIFIKPTFFDLKIKNHFFSDEKINDSTSSIIKLSLSF